MKSNKSNYYFGGLQAFLFAVGMYLVALFFAIFLCSSLFYNMKKHEMLGWEFRTQSLTSRLI